MPCLVGKSLYEAVGILSENNLNPRLMAEKEDPDLPAGTVISQSPRTHQKIKPHQSVFLLLSKKPPAQFAPSLVHMPTDSITQKLTGSGLRNKNYALPSHYPKNSCITQIPNTQEPLEKNTVTLYISAGTDKPVIWPDFINKPLEQVKEFLEYRDIQPHIVHSLPVKIHHDCAHCTITDQRPLPGSLIMLDKQHPPYVQLHVR